jgi:hypothetical protein
MTLEHLDTAIAFVVILLGASLLITILTQTISAALGYRGAQLNWALKTLIFPKYSRAKGVESLVRQILTDDRVSDSILSKLDNSPLTLPVFQRWTRASAIRFDELVDLLEEIANSDAPNCPTANAKPNADIADQPRTIARSLLATAAGVTNPTAGGIRVAQDDLQKFHKWFDSAMDRAAQRFTVYIRVWTVLFAIAFAFIAHLDAFRLFSQLSTDAELRAKIAASADALTNKAGEIISTEGKDVPGLYSEAMKDLQEKEAAVNALGRIPRYQTQQQYEEWLRTGLQNNTNLSDFIAQYELLVQTKLGTAMERLQNQAISLKSIFEESQVQLWPQPYPPNWNKDNLWGILICAALLSLGAPFWFNTLKDLLNFRSAVARTEKDASNHVSAV